MPFFLFRISTAAFSQNAFCRLFDRNTAPRSLSWSLAQLAFNSGHTGRASASAPDCTVLLRRDTLPRYCPQPSSVAGAAPLSLSTAAKDESNVVVREGGVRMTVLVLRAYALLLSFEAN